MCIFKVPLYKRMSNKGFIYLVKITTNVFFSIRPPQKTVFRTFSFCLKRQWTKWVNKFSNRTLDPHHPHFNSMSKRKLFFECSPKWNLFICVHAQSSWKMRPAFFMLLAPLHRMRWQGVVGVPERVSLRVHFQSSPLMKMEVALAARKRCRLTLFYSSCFGRNEVLWVPQPRPVFH